MRIQLCDRCGRVTKNQASFFLEHIYMLPLSGSCSQTGWNEAWRSAY